MTRSWTIAISLAAACVFASAAFAADEPPAGEYRIVDGKVDAGTYRGWMTYYLACQSCHGGERPGIAPDLSQSLRTMLRSEFVNKVLTRYRVNLSLAESVFSDSVRQAMIDEVERQEQSAKKGVAMPAWQSDATISQRVLDLHAYLRARADGKIGPGRPRTMGE